MLLIDDLLLAPVRGVLWIFREIHKAARQELEGEPESIAEQLRNLYMQLETNAVSEQEFTKQEKILLDRLEEIEGRRELGGQEEASAGEQAEEVRAHEQEQ